LKNAALLKALKESQTLKHISIQTACYWLPIRSATTDYTITLKGFRNLASLEVYHFNDEKWRLLKDLIDTLEDCPHLQTLGLGFACDFNSVEFPEAIVVGDEDLDFLEKLCLGYGSRTSALPLPLKTLKLGHGMFLLKPKKTSSIVIENFLAKLVRISNLRTLHLFNGLFMMGVDAEMEQRELEWSFFERCTSLYQLSVTRLQSDVRDWLNTVAKSVQELIVTHNYGMYDDELMNFNMLNIPHLAMLFTREDRGLQHERFNPDPGPMPRSDVHWSTKTVLDRLYDGGSQLTRLYLDIDFEDHWVR
jgi:hypothetical protein